MPIFKGSGVAIVTPFNDDAKKSINFDAFEKLIEFQIKNGTDAIIVCGTTGEASTLTDEEQIEMIRFAVEKVNKRVPVVAGTGSNHTDHGIELCKMSRNAGADACLSVTPYYNKTSQKGLYEHYLQMAKAVDIPIILYNVPSRTGLNIASKTAAELSKIENIVAIKEAGGDFKHIAEIAYMCDGRLDIYSGNDHEILPILSLGGIGVISVLANVAPKETHDMIDLFLNGHNAEAKKLQLDYMPLINALFCDVNPIPVKAALNLMGFDVGGYRMPLTSLDPANLDLLKDAMRIVKAV